MRPFQKFSTIFVATLSILSASAAWGQSQNSKLNYVGYVSAPYNYSGPICIQLGQWDGNANVLLESGNFYSEATIRNATHFMNQALLLNVNSSTNSSITVYADRPLSPDLTKGLCQSSKTPTKIISLNWRRR